VPALRVRGNIKKIDWEQDYLRKKGSLKIGYMQQKELMYMRDQFHFEH
jgi:hypothetical protein